MKYLPSFVCLLALECCCSFHLFAKYISGFYLHGVHLRFFNIFKSFSLTLPCSTQCVPMLLVDFSFIFKIFQFFLMVLVIFSRNQLYVITRGILSDFCRVSLSVIRWILLSRLILSRCSLINDVSYPCFTGCFSIP